MNYIGKKVKEALDTNRLCAQGLKIERWTIRVLTHFQSIVIYASEMSIVNFHFSIYSDRQLMNKLKSSNYSNHLA